MPPNRQMILKIDEALRKGEALVDKLAKDESLRQRFVDSPGSVLSENNFLTNATDAAISKTNRMFLAIVTNRNLYKWLKTAGPQTPATPRTIASIRKWAQDQGPLRIPDDWRNKALNSYIGHEQFLQNVGVKLARDPAVSRLLPRGVGGLELGNHLINTVRAIRNGKPPEELPRLPSDNGETEMSFVLVVLVVLVVFIIVVVDKHDGALVPGTKETRDLQLVRNLWQLSEQITRMSPR